MTKRLTKPTVAVKKKAPTESAFSENAPDPVEAVEGEGLGPMKDLGGEPGEPTDRSLGRVQQR